MVIASREFTCYLCIVHANNYPTFRTYETYVRPFLTEKKSTLFNILREQMTMISALAYEHPGLPHFSWDVLKQNLSIDEVVFYQ